MERGRKQEQKARERRSSSAEIEVWAGEMVEEGGKGKRDTEETP